MTDLEIINNNKLIAEFMGVKPCKKHPDKQCFLTIKDNKHSSLQYWHLLKYHSSWDWLIPVVKEVFSLEFNSVEGFREYSNEPNTLFNAYACGLHSDRIHVWKKLVEFIKWYNSEKK